MEAGGTPTPEEIQLLLGIHPSQMAANNAFVAGAQGDSRPIHDMDTGEAARPPEAGALGQPSTPSPHVEAPNLERMGNKYAAADARSSDEPDHSSLFSSPGPRPVPLNIPMGNRPAPDVAAGQTPETSGNVLSAPITPQSDPLQEREAQDRAELARKESTGSGVSQFQQRHHVWGPIVRGLDIAGSVLAPGVSAAIPGTELHHRVLLNEDRAHIAGDLEAEHQRAETAGTQASTRYHNAQADELENTSEVTGADGQKYRIPNKDLEKYLGAQTGAKARTDVAHISADNKAALAQLKADIDSGKVAAIRPVLGPDGKTAVLGAYDKFGNFMHTLDRSIGPAWLQPTVRSSVDVKEDGNGGYIYIPKTSTSQRILPGVNPAASGKPTAQPPATPPAAAGSGTPPAGNVLKDPIQAGAPAPAPFSLKDKIQVPQRPTGANGAARPVTSVRPVMGGDGQQAGGKIRKDAGYAIDPQSGQTYFTTRMEASQKGYQNFQKTSGTQVKEDKQIINRLSDVETKLGRYAKRWPAQQLSSETRTNSRT